MHGITRKRSLFNVAVAALLALSAISSAAQGVAGVAPDMQLLLERCAPSVHPETMAAVVLAESRGQRFALADAGPRDLPWSKRKAMVRSFYFATLPEAASKARSLIAAGHTVSLGPAQINDRQLPRLGLSIEDVFEPCTNLGAGARILTACYESAAKKYGRGDRALRAALSCYNSGDFDRGERDGYVERVRQQVGRPLALRTGADRVARSEVLHAGPWWKGLGAHGKRGERASFAMSARDFNVTE